jgi:homoserine kinase
LPATVPHPEAARNAGRAALLVHALTVAPELLLPATEDWLHQPYRATAVPASARLIARLRDFGLPAVLSGAGPAVLVVQVAGDRHRVGELAGPRWEVRPVAVDGGARVTPFRRPGPGRTGAAISR